MPNPSNPISGNTTVLSNNNTAPSYFNKTNEFSKFSIGNEQSQTVSIKDTLKSTPLIIKRGGEISFNGSSNLHSPKFNMGSFIQNSRSAKSGISRSSSRNRSKSSGNLRSSYSPSPDKASHFTEMRELAKKSRKSRRSEQVSREEHSFSKDLEEPEDIIAAEAENKEFNPKMVKIIKEGLDLDDSIEHLEGYLGHSRDEIPTDRRSSSCQSYTYIPVKTFKRFVGKSMAQESTGNG
jgi:hypothetical protein